jgi:DnaJ-class molecular chaperone
MSPEGFKPPERRKSPYEILGISTQATDKEIGEAFRALAKESHPEIEGGGDEDRFKEISEAYAQIKTSEKRAEYDRSQDPVQKTQAPVPRSNAARRKQATDNLADILKGWLKE